MMIKYSLFTSYRHLFLLSSNWTSKFELFLDFHIISNLKCCRAGLEVKFFLQSKTLIFQVLYTHTHTHTHIYIYIYFCIHEYMGNKVLAFNSVQFSHSVMSDSLWPHGLQHASIPCPSPTPRACSNSCPSSWWCHPAFHPLSSPFPPAFNLSQQQGLFKWVSSLHQVAKVLDLEFRPQFFHEYSGLISFRIDWLDLLAVQGTLKSLLQHHSSKVSILQL